MKKFDSNLFLLTSTASSGKKACRDTLNKYYQKEPELRYLAAVIIITLFPLRALCCTSAVVSGRATPDGRPLLWKHRDSSYPENIVRRFDGAEYSFTGIVNADSTSGSQIWIGTNEAGFSIMNTASYNLLEEGEYKGEMDREGIFMLKAMGGCGTVADFEKMLEETNGSRGVEANFGVIDGLGGAAYFETGPFEYMKYDVTDPEVAPAGYLIRTNFSFAGDSKKGYGYIRYRTISDLFLQEYFERGYISNDFIILQGTRCLKHSLLGLDLFSSPLPSRSRDRKLVPLNDFIPRSSSVSSMVIQGVAPGEDPGLSVMWIVLGFPPVTPVFPVLADEENIPEILTGGNDKSAYVNAEALRLKEKVFPISVGSGERYLDLAPLLNRKGDGLLQQVLDIDRATISEAEELFSRLRDGSRGGRDLEKLYRNTEERIGRFFSRN